MSNMSFIKQVVDFFDQLHEFSVRYFQKNGISETETPWTYGEFKTEFPIGAIIHFTAGTTSIGAVRWFMHRRLAARVSAHVVIDPGWPDGCKELARGLPAIEVLPTMVVQCQHPNKTAWHARYVNTMCHGLELVNPGEIRKRQGRWVTWPNGWTREWVSSVDPVFSQGKYWASYSWDQVLSTLIVLSYLHNLPYSHYRKQWVLGHEQVQQNKSDPGPLFPLEGIRETLFDYSYDWFGAYNGDQFYHRWRQKKIAQEWAQIEDMNLAWAKFMAAILSTFENAEFGALGKTALRMLGYAMSPLSCGVLHSDIVSIQRFQKMMKLKVDGMPGPITRRGILERMGMKGFFKIKDIE